MREVKQQEPISNATEEYGPGLCVCVVCVWKGPIHVPFIQFLPIIKTILQGEMRAQIKYPFPF